MANNVDYKPLFLSELQRYIEKFPEYTLGQILYSIFAQANRSGNNIDKKSSLLEVTDKDMYSSINKSIKEETE